MIYKIKDFIFSFVNSQNFKIYIQKESKIDLPCKMFFNSGNLKGT